MTRDEHLAACKARSLALLDAGERGSAVAAMIRGLEEHPDTSGHADALGGVVLALAGFLRTDDEMRRWIEGFR